MGVLRCNRGDCEKIMCSRYSHKYGYICESCFEELVKLGADTDIEHFMNSNVKQGNPKLFDSLPKWNEEFPFRD